MFLSIIIPVHNVEEYVQDCIESVLNQQSDDYEVLLIENASTDSSLEICKRYEHNPKISVYSLEKGGVSNARNFGIRKAQGQYIWFVDSDDVISDNAVKHLKERVECFSNPDVLIFTHNEIIEGKKTAPKKYPYEQIIDRTTAINGLFDANLWNGYICNKIIKNNTNVLKDCMFPENIHMIEDLTFFTKLFLRFDSFAVTNGCLYSYRKRDGSISSVFNEKKLSAFDAYEMILNELNGLKEFDFAKKIINNAKVDFSRQILSYYCINDKVKYKEIRRHYKRIIVKNFRYITRFKAKIAAFLTLISPKLIQK